MRDCTVCSDTTYDFVYSKVMGATICRECIREKDNAFWKDFVIGDLEEEDQFAQMALNAFMAEITAKYENDCATVEFDLKLKVEVKIPHGVFSTKEMKAFNSLGQVINNNIHHITILLNGKSHQGNDQIGNDRVHQEVRPLLQVRQPRRA